MQKIVKVNVESYPLKEKKGKSTRKNKHVLNAGYHNYFVTSVYGTEYWIPMYTDMTRLQHESGH